MLRIANAHCGITFESESHVLLLCNLYNNIYLLIPAEIVSVEPGFPNLSDVETLNVLPTNPLLMRMSAKTGFKCNFLGFTRHWF